MNEAYPVVTEEEIGRSLSSAIDLYGPSLLRQPERLRAYLDKHCPDATVEIAAIVAAIVTQVPQAMLAADADDDAALDLRGHVERIVRQASLDRRQARWVVRVWARALAVSTRGLDREAPDERARVRVDARASAAEVLRVHTARSPVPVINVPPPAPVVPAFEAVNVAGARAEAEHVSTKPPHVESSSASSDWLSSNFPEAPPVQEQRASIVAATEHVDPASPSDDVGGQSVPVVPSPPLPEPIFVPAAVDAAAGLGQTASPRADASPAGRSEPVVAADEVARIDATMRDAEQEHAPPTVSVSQDDARPTQVDAAEGDGADGAPPVADPPWMSPGPGRRRSGRLTGIAAVVGAALAVAIVLIPFARQSAVTPEDSTEPAVAPAPASSTAQPAAQPAIEPSSSTAGSEAASTTPPVNSASTSGEPSPVRQADGAAAVGAPTPGSAAATPAVGPDAVVAASPTPTAATTPSTADAAPPSTASPSTTTATVPATTTPPPPKLADATPAPLAAAVPSPAAVPVPELPRSAGPASRTPDQPESRGAASPRDAVAQPASKGVTSQDAKPVAPKATPGTKPITPTTSRLAVATDTAGKAKPATSATPRVAAKADKGAAAAKPSTACTRADCGSVVAIRPAPGDPRIFEMTLRMDDRSIRTLVQPLPLRPGTRLRRAGSRYVPAPAN